MLKATINNIDYEIIDGSINWELNAVSDFNITTEMCYTKR
jgi:hypothetical protein